MEGAETHHERYPYPYFLVLDQDSIAIAIASISLRFPCPLPFFCERGTARHNEDQHYFMYERYM